MIEDPLASGDAFNIHFVWQIPNGDFLRAIFEAQIITHIPGSERYLVELLALKAGRQESKSGIIRDKSQLDRDHWRLVGSLIGRKAAVAYEAADGRPLYLILRTLTGEHPFFTQFDPFNSEELLRWAQRH